MGFFNLGTMPPDEERARDGYHATSPLNIAGVSELLNGQAGDWQWLLW